LGCQAKFAGLGQRRPNKNAAEILVVKAADSRQILTRSHSLTQKHDLLCGPFART
jgi:hypothetical protein